MLIETGFVGLGYVALKAAVVGWKFISAIFAPAKAVAVAKVAVASKAIPLAKTVVVVKGAALAKAVSANAVIPATKVVGVAPALAVGKVSLPTAKASVVGQTVTAAACAQDSSLKLSGSLAIPNAFSATGQVTATIALSSDAAAAVMGAVVGGGLTAAGVVLGAKITKGRGGDSS